jgi:hypothetical protein
MRAQHAEENRKLQEQIIAERENNKLEMHRMFAVSFYRLIIAKREVFHSLCNLESSKTICRLIVLHKVFPLRILLPPLCTLQKALCTLQKPVHRIILDHTQATTALLVVLHSSEIDSGEFSLPSILGIIQRINYMF